MEYRSLGMCKSSYCCGATPSCQKKESPTRDTECYKCRKKGHFKGSCRSKKEVGRAKGVKRKHKLAKVHEVKTQVTAGTWMQQPCTVQHSPPSQRGPQGVMFHKWTASASRRTTSTSVPCHKLPIAQSIVSSPTNQPVCGCLIIKLFTQVVSVVTNHS